jgi:predicted ATP-grasp superfamily ATP-dependent carboligase
MDSRPAVLIAAAACRALAASAVRAGYRPLVADYFGDQDTVATAGAHVRLENGLTHGMQDTEVMSALNELATGSSPIGVVWGTGFEDRPEILEQITQRWKLLGNPPGKVATAKDPIVVEEICDRCGIPHPEVSLDRPASLTGWLVKRRGGAGGSHVRPADGPSVGDAAIYFQRRHNGTAVSALVLADGRRASILGLSSQWTSPTIDRPFRYGGAAQPAMIGQEMAGLIGNAAVRVTSTLGLIGLNSIDFLIDDTAFWLLEINPRPGATVDLFERDDAAPLFARHVAACNGMLMADPPATHGATAAGIVYAARDIASVPDFDWPDWTADRPAMCTSVLTDQPLCTVLASAATPAKARVLLDQRIATIVAWTGAWLS